MPIDPPPLRLFIAVPVPPPVGAALAAARAAFEQAGAPRLRWVRPEGLHLTLRFLGNTAPERVETITAAIGAAARQTPAHTLHLDAYGTNGGRLRVLWTTLGGDVEETRALAARLGAALAAEGWPHATRPLRPHITLARTPHGLSAADRETLRRLLGGVPPPPPLPLPVEAIHLFQSTLGPAGAQYAALTVIPCGKGEQV